MKNCPRYSSLLLSMSLLMTAVGKAQFLPANPNEPSFSANTPYGDEDGGTFIAERVKKYFHASIGAGVRYDDNIFLTNSNEVDDIIWSISPSFILNNGGIDAAVNTIEFRYSPSFQFYADNTDRNTVNHHFGLNYGLNLAKTKVRASLFYSETEGSNRFTSGTIGKELIDARLSVSRILTQKTRLDVGLGARIDLFGDSALIDNDAFTASTTLFYAYSPKTNVGISVGYGFDSTERGADHESYDISLKATYKVTGKTNLSASLGYEIREFDSGFRGRQEPSWNLGVTHRLTDYTTVNASFYHTGNPSFNLEDTGFQALGFSLGLQQLISERTTWGARFAYENDDFFRTDVNGSNLDNDYYVLRLELDHLLDNGLTLGAFTQWQVQDSSSSLNDFEGFSFGLNASYNLW